MKLWLLLPNTPDHYWDPWHDTTAGVVVRAESEKQARAIAATKHHDEGKAVWYDPESTTCEPLKVTGKAGPILVSEHWA